MTTEDLKPKKAKKEKGPIRLEAIIPVTIVFGLSFIYFFYFFDGHLRRGLEWAGGQAHGAEVNIGSLKTSFTGASLLVGNIQVTDKKQPERNLVQIEKFHLKFLWDALLRAKFVTENAEVKNIQAFTKRKSAGKVYPPKPNSTAKKLEDSVKAQITEQYSDNVLGDLTQLLDGVDPKDQLKNIQTELKSDQRIKELENIVKEKEKEWKKRLEELPQKEELDALAARAKKLEKINTKDPLAIARGIDELGKILKEADKSYKAYKVTSKDLKGDMGSLKGSFKDLEKLAKQDLDDLQNRLKIPKIDAQSLSQGIFAKMFSSKLGQVQKYMALSRQYMPNKKVKDESTLIIPRKRGKGRDFKYPITTGYPFFWLKRAFISSEPSDSEYSGSLKGEIKNITNAPASIKDPATVHIAGDFPKMEILGLNSLITIDHRTDEAVESINAVVKSYPLSSFQIANDDNLTLMLKKSVGTINLNASLKNQQLNVKINNWFKDNNFIIKTKSKSTEKILTDIFDGLPNIDIQSRATGSWEKISWHIRSNLGSELEKAFKAQLQAKINEARALLKAQIDKRIGEQKKKLTAELDKVTGGITSKLTAKGTEIEKIKAGVNKEIKSSKSSAKHKLEDDVKKKAKDALKKLFGN